MTHTKRRWSQFAVLLIDLQKGFWDPPIVEAFPYFPRQVARLLDLCRTEGIDIRTMVDQLLARQSEWERVLEKLQGPEAGGVPGLGRVLQSRSL